MPWIRTVGVEAANGRLADTYRAAVERAGRVFGILRAEIAREGGDTGLADAVLADWRNAPLAPVDAALCAYAEKLTREPAAMTEADLQPLRDAGLDDRAIHNAIQVIAFFNYINRVADAAHVELEPEMPPYPDGSR